MSNNQADTNSFEKKKRSFDSINNDLMDVLRTYPNISFKNDINRFVPIYYPIAIIDVEVDEQSFEDFKSIQLLILKVYSKGYKDPKKIANILGITSNYVRRVISVLEGYGHIKDGHITPVGETSLKQGKNIQLKTQVQRFQVNALTGELLKINNVIMERQLDKIEESRGSVIHVRPINGIEKEVIRQQLSQQNYQDYVFNDTDVLSVNAVEIRDIELVDIKYAYCYAMGIVNTTGNINTTDYIIMIKTEGKEKGGKHCWKPLSVPDAECRNYFGGDLQIPIMTQQEKRYLVEALKHSYQRERQINDRYHVEYIEKYMREKYGVETINADIREYKGKVYYLSRWTQFREYNQSLFFMLKDFGNDDQGYEIISTDRNHGKIVMIVPGDEIIKKVSLLLNKRVDEYGMKIVQSNLEQNFKNKKDDNLLKHMLKLLYDFDNEVNLF